MDLPDEHGLEIIFENLVLDHNGIIVVTTNALNQWSPATAVVDLDGDEFMELIHPSRAFRHDGTLYDDAGNLGVGFTAVANMGGSAAPQQVEYPVVADVDNDGSAEIVVGSSHPYVYSGEPNPYPTVQVLEDAQSRWIQARRIWNQHTYHVSNVREDGTIPQFEPRSWEGLNTFRTNAQIEGGGICDPAG